jgi:RNase P subunit RPR2
MIDPNDYNGAVCPPVNPTDEELAAAEKLGVSLDRSTEEGYEIERCKRCGRKVWFGKNLRKLRTVKPDLVTLCYACAAEIARTEEVTQIEHKDWPAEVRPED